MENHLFPGKLYNFVSEPVKVFGFMDSTQEILGMLKSYKDRFALKYGIERLGVFGSVARGEQDDESDIDIVIKMQRPNLLRRICIREELEDMFQRKVDLITLHENQLTGFRKNVEADAIYV
ncbi:nucleotidyltransferase family protein [Bacteroides rodentium]